ncbi:BON domain-containing protein [Terasakiella sp. A23]|uniref:BON domain-containing protein n=1 Tax=Terasakiella sp. FCG-A23 TaxID=3080561 RepID=UPI002954FCDB|nr:BON domain-containing protein [Terasakiella sp. A23]MDV7339906.1 BON domain-containing protein [Terasakiella sp. A23]
MIPRFFALLLVSFTLISCTPIGMLVTAGTTAGSMAMEERGLDGAANDYSLKADILGNWTGENLSYASDLTVIVYNGKAMVAGSVESDEERARAIDLAWQVEGIKEVYNEIILSDESDVQNFAHDTWISAKLYTATTFDPQLMEINYKYTVQGGTVYVTGMAQSKAELERFIAHAKSMPYVQKVVSHVELKPRKSMFKKKTKPVAQK